MATQECPIHENLKQAFVKASIYDTMIIMRSLNATHRVWNNQAAQKVIELENSKSDQMDIFNAAAGAKSKMMYEEGNLDVGVVSVGQGVGLIHDIPSVKDLIEGIMKEANMIIQNLANK